MGRFNYNRMNCNFCRKKSNYGSAYVGSPDSDSNTMGRKTAFLYSLPFVEFRYVYVVRVTMGNFIDLSLQDPVSQTRAHISACVSSLVAEYNCPPDAPRLLS